MLRRERELPARFVVEAADAAPRRAARVNVAGATAREIASAVGARDLSPVEIVEETLARIERVQPSVNAFPFVRADAALEDARNAEKRLASGEPARALEGVPFTAKDLCAIADGPTNHGSRAFAGTKHGVDAEVVARLKRAGGILVATTASSEFGNRPTTENELYGATRNPWNLERTCGGSSGGAGVSAALGVAPLNQGSDGGGSLRIPSSCCGVFGLKPTRGRITLAPLMAEEWGGLDVYGPIARSVADAALFMDVTAGPLHDPYYPPPPLRSFSSAVTEERPLKIAVAFERDGERVDEETKAAVRATADLLASLGHDVVEDQPDLGPLEQPFLIVSTVGIGMMAMTPEQLDSIEARTRLIFDVAANVRAVDYARALKAMHLESRRAMEFWDRYDVLLTPTLSRPAPVIGEIARDIEHAWEDYRNWLSWTWPFNITGQPAASVPAGFNADGLPVGAQIVGAYGDERTVLSVAGQLERARPWADARPPLW